VGSNPVTVREAEEAFTVALTDLIRSLSGRGCSIATSRGMVLGLRAAGSGWTSLVKSPRASGMRRRGFKSQPPGLSARIPSTERDGWRAGEEPDGGR